MLSHHHHYYYFHYFHHRCFCSPLYASILLGENSFPSFFFCGWGGGGGGGWVGGCRGNTVGKHVLNEILRLLLFSYFIFFTKGLWPRQNVIQNVVTILWCQMPSNPAKEYEINDSNGLFFFLLLVFTKRSRDHKIPLNSRYHVFDSRNG